MKVFIVFAHPEPQSLNGSLLRTTVEELEAQGHEVKVSDLYAMQWKAQVDRADFPHFPAESRMRVAYASKDGYETKTLTDDVKAEQEKIVWADTIIFQFPIWWNTMPAILKGWFERVYALGFAYGIGEHSDKHWGDRYGEGIGLGKRSMLSLTIGGWPQHYSARGIGGPIDDVLYPITHGLLYYIGMEVLPPFIVWKSDWLDDKGFQTAADELRGRLRTLSTTKHIDFRKQNGGDYEIPTLTLKPGLEDPSTAGFSIHSRKAEVNGTASSHK
ncbi:NAD(P)H dehydrogenase (quinone) [Fusarium albosuccineum]|uniref:NAD(P)H dehydrogenase (Quinone) n=1 Tax=Fusarium albosuccineum TaxID=1237068 RepID=A0A8H4L8J6_9HYPO|nr:NAD(P)H dehydrogenase (quinone) [Fusarium albosuccineum]